MSADAKITLSAKELSLVSDMDLIISKQKIIEKAYLLFSECASLIQNRIMPAHSFPDAALFSVPKISRGENYLGMPYVMLDYPRVFEKENIFALRTMFWWGNFISITLHVAGTYKHCIDMNKLATVSCADRLYVCVAEDQWAHHFESDNYLPVNHFTDEALTDLIGKNRFLKLALKYELKYWNEMPEKLMEAYHCLASVLVNFPGDEKGL